MEPNEILTEITADWARKAATSIMSQDAKIELQTSLELIRVAVAANQFSCKTSKLYDVVLKELKNRGFKVDYVSGSPINRSEVGYCCISW